MQVQNFECQIAKAQIGRYLAGDSMSEDLLGQLEAHISKCTDCKDHLAEKRATLQAMLAPNTEQPQIEKPAPAKFDLAEFIKTKIRSKQPVQAAVHTDTPKAFAKPAVYSVALGAVLIGMSYASRNMGSLLGPTAEKVGSASSIVTPSQPTQKVETPKAEPKPSLPASKPADPEPKASQPKSTAPEPKPAKQAAVTTATHEVHHPRRAPRRPHNSIRVYAPGD